MVKRGGDIPGLGLPGPQATNLYNFAGRLADQLDARNAWAHCVNQLNPELPSALQIPRITWFRFVRLRRDWMLARDDREDLWVLHTLAHWLECERARRRKDDDGDAAGGDGGGSAPSGGGKGGSGGSARDQHDDRPALRVADDYPSISAAPRRARASQPEREGLLWTAHRLVRRAPLFRHTLWLIRANAPRMKAAAQRLAARAQNVLGEALRRLNDLFADRGQVVQNERFGAMFEPQIVERAGLRLMVLTFSAYPRPDWESWLFGKPIEEDQWLYEIGQGAQA